MESRQMTRIKEGSYLKSNRGRRKGNKQEGRRGEGEINNRKARKKEWISL
jgi:hypothetical protein